MLVSLMAGMMIVVGGVVLLAIRPKVVALIQVRVRSSRRR
jgi:hypothetical protein